MAAQYFDVEEIHRIIFREAPETSDESETSTSGEES